LFALGMARARRSDLTNRDRVTRRLPSGRVGGLHGLAEHVDCTGPVPVLSLEHSGEQVQQLVGGIVEFVQVPSAVT
jgi:hypothetical protein